MNKVRIAEFKKRLLECRNETSADIKNKLRNFREKSSSTVRRIENRDDCSGGYCDVQETDTDFDLSLIQIQNNKLALINEALRRLESGRYGYCSDCHSEISEARLRALPFAVRCKDCEELREKSA